MSDLASRRVDPRAIATRESGYYLCTEHGDECQPAIGFCAHVWNWVRGYDAAVVSVLYGSAVVDADPHGLTAPVLADLARALEAARVFLEAAEGEGRTA